ncbi:RNA recognition motif domain-containing protein [Chitiniphilus eburneus]|uniref:RNA-binding protein n=1 Tax=Chitiniphilus eburneus TaxID=2571148 RepID=A0A4U0QCM4_9NEIS|nr:RNA-binding protein [Chitiniphilus eburneus]TJZ79056.1 RNA-binding protein [Chitiniphilus eburneus]
MQMMLGNLPPDTTIDDVRELLESLGVPGVSEITVSAGLGERANALVKLDEAVSSAAVSAICGQLNGHHWKGHDITASHTNLGWG